MALSLALPQAVEGHAITYKCHRHYFNRLYYDILLMKLSLALPQAVDVQFMHLAFGLLHFPDLHVREQLASDEARTDVLQVGVCRHPLQHLDVHDLPKLAAHLLVASLRRMGHDMIRSLLLGGSGGVVDSPGFCPASLKSLDCFYFRCVLF